MSDSYIDRQIQACGAFRWAGALSVCRGCCKPLTGRQQRWCGMVCRDEYGRNHWWTEARPARLALDNYTCQRCGTQSEPRDDQWEFRQRIGYYDGPHIKREDARRVFTGPPLEVNHIWPLAHQGKRHDHSGCHHHLSLLVTLCQPCHRRETNRQFGFKQQLHSSLPGVAA